MTTKTAALAQIDRTLTLLNNTIDLWHEWHRTAIHNEPAPVEDILSAVHKCKSSAEELVRRLSPPGSHYPSLVKEPFAVKSGDDSTRLRRAKGVLESLRDDYENDCLLEMEELVRADVFSDLLDQAEHLLELGYKDPAAVLVGAVPEEHLKKLCAKHAVDAHKPDGKPKSADAINADLAGASVYSKADQKSVTAWQAIRNDAAHGNFAAYDKPKVDHLLLGVRHFLILYPA